MSALRAKQKASRQRRILESALRQFRDQGFQQATIEAVAAGADVSAMTVFNYYGSKGGILLALVAESDRMLVKKILAVINATHDTAANAVTKYSLAILDHAFSYLDRTIWRHVLATVMTEGTSGFGSDYLALDQELVRLLVELLERLKSEGLLAKDCDCSIAGQVIYSIHNARFVEFVMDAEMTRSQAEMLVSRDIEFLMNRLCT
jgi:AcrR family transcriptional regulator